MLTGQSPKERRNPFLHTDGKYEFLVHLQCFTERAGPRVGVKC